MFFEVLKIKDLLPKDTEFESKVIIEDGDRKIILFSLDKEQEISEHTSPVDAAIYVIEGEILLCHSGNTHKIKETEMFLIPQNKVHKVKAEKKSLFFVTRI